MQISRRDALLGASAAAVAVGVPVAGETIAAGRKTPEALVNLWRERIQLRAKADRISAEADAIHKALPEWARISPGIGKSMGIAARRMAPGLAQFERLAGEARS